MIKNFFTQTPSYYNDWLSRLAPRLLVSCFLEHRGPKVSSKVLLHHSIFAQCPSPWELLPLSHIPLIDSPQTLPSVYAPGPSLPRS